MVKTGYNLSRIKLVCNQVGREAGHLTLEHVEATLNQPMFHTIVDDWKTVSGAINMGEPLTLHAPKSKVRLCIRDLAEKIRTPASMQDESAAAKKPGGLLSKIFSD
jgi:MinD-like ATPase involved in chromosome partitioning or flagellar assembly